MRTSRSAFQSRFPWGGLLAAALLLATSLLWSNQEVYGRSAKAPPKPVIHGSWALNCESARGMVVNIVSAGKEAAVGSVKVLGKGRRFRYNVGEEILRLKVYANGNWRGQYLWRNEDGVSRWQEISLRLVDVRLHGASANEHCFEYMERAR